MFAKEVSVFIRMVHKIISNFEQERFRYASKDL